MQTVKSRRIRVIALVLAVLAVGGAVWMIGNAAGGGKSQKLPRRFASKTITKRTPGHAVDVDVDISGAKKLYLVVTDAGNGFSCDWADWAEPRLIGPKGERKLTDLKWKFARADWGRVRKNRNANGGPLMIAGKAVKYGIGTHANSIIAFELPAGYTRFKARGGLDNGGTDQGGGNTTSVQFHVYLDKLPKNVVRRRPSGGGGLDPANALEALDAGEGLEATLFAAEPMLLSPSDMDIDDKGRVWVCEVVNYRRRNGQRPEGDRILILEDTNGDGKADKKTVFHQGRDIDSAHGICVLPTPSGKNTKVIVSVGSGVYIFTDKDGDGKADDKKTLFTGISGTQHDHGIHAFVFGPDGRLYFNFGNAGRQIRDAKGKPIVDMAGNVVAANRNPYQDGMVFRCNMDGSKFETLGWNFRNNWEVAVDSFGTLWQSDNDDDGNRGVRINYVMEFGNYGYLDEMTGAGWRSPRTGMSSDIPTRHWHQNDPGVVPNLLQTGAGSPTGICVYEGKLLPKVFHNQVIHTDAGPNIVRSYPVQNDGAGYKAKIVNILSGTRDRWFRPSDVCVAPDGSILIADWYDPGVGGHGMGDTDKGRIFRITPKKMTAYKIPHYDYSTPEGAIKALHNPNLAIRYMAWTALHKMQGKAEPALLTMASAKEEPRFRARALWLLGQIKGKEKQYIDKMVSDKNADIRIVGLRLARKLDLDVLHYVTKLAGDSSPQVRRECAIALRFDKSSQMPELWAELAAQQNGKDRWYLEALGIGAHHRWDECLDAWLGKVGGKWNTPAGRDIIWRSRAKKTPEYLAKIIADPKTTREELPRYFRAFDFLTGKEKEGALIQLAFAEARGGADRTSFIAAESVSRLKGFDVNNNPKHKAALNRVLNRSKGTSEFVKLVSKFQVRDRYPELLAMAQKNPQSQLGVDAVVALLNSKQQPLLRKAIHAKDQKKALATVQALTTAKDGRVFGLLMPLVKNKKADLELRREAVRAVAGTRKGAQKLVNLAAEDKLDPQLKSAAGAALHQVQFRYLKARIAKLFPLPAGKNNVKLPPINQLLSMNGNAARGMKIFRTTGTCANCHVVHKFGKEVGPNLSEIGDKLSKQAFYESILFPSAAISHNYENYLVGLKNGTVANGLLVSQTPAEVTIKSSDAIEHTFKRSDIDVFVKQPVSLMPEDLAKLMSAQDLADVVSYLMTLRKSNAPKTSSFLHEGQRPEGLARENRMEERIVYAVEPSRPLHLAK